MDPEHYDALMQYYHKFKMCPQKNNYMASPDRSLAAIDDLPILKVSLELS